MANQVNDIVDLAKLYAKWIRETVQPLGILKFSEVSDALITPQGDIIPFNRRAMEVQKVFGLTPVEFQKRFNAPADNALLSRGYIYVNGGIIQAGVSGSGLSKDQNSLITQYLNTLPQNTEVEITLLIHDVNSFKLIEETPIYQGVVSGALDKLLNMPSQTGELSFQNMPQYQYIPQKGGVPRETPSAEKSKGQQFKFQTHPHKPTTSSIKFSDIISEYIAPTSIRLIEGRTWMGLPVIRVDDSVTYVIATREMADVGHDGFFKPLLSANLTINDLPKQVLRALEITRGFEGEIYVYNLD